MAKRNKSLVDFSAGLVTPGGGRTTTLALATAGADVHSAAKHMRLSDEFNSGTTGSGQIGSLGWRLCGSTTTPTAAPVASETDHPGIARITPGTQTSGYQTALLTFGANQIGLTAKLSNIDEWLWIVRCNGTPDKDMRIGILSTPLGEPTAGVYLEKLAADTNWFAVVRQDGAASVTRVDTGVAFTASAWINVSARRGTTGWIFKLNGGADMAEITTTLPAETALMGAAVQISDDSADQPTFDLDFFALCGTVAR